MNIRNFVKERSMSIQEPLDELFFAEPPRKLRELLEQIPDTIFYNKDGNPDYNGIFVEITRTMYGREDRHFTIDSEDFLNGTLPNLSTFQRSVSYERARRRKQY